ncbi:isocitrate lyase/phosphoenolpyruvate mutase family protein [Streptomyces sp. NPDC051644]|uniref:isocitrate lyase/phosphoenolpyruvate mutase family protein n=1 Tax=Streptomyces sp. NPDC051644 TaxID=3365666 RepID=UPI00378C037A
MTARTHRTTGARDGMPHTATLLDKAQSLRSLHIPGRPSILPNAWDAASARVVADAGAPAIATTSAGIAWSLGQGDGDHLNRDQALAAIARITAAVDIPDSADIERASMPRQYPPV